MTRRMKNCWKWGGMKRMKKSKVEGIKMNSTVDGALEKNICNWLSKSRAIRHLRWCRKIVKS